MASAHALARRWPAWRAGPLWIPAIVAAVAIIHWSTVRELAGLGERTDGQFPLVVGAFLFMVWHSRDALERLPIRPSSWGLAALCFLSLAWLAGELMLVRLLTDASVVAMIPAAVLALLGMSWVRALAFPLAFVLLAIPIEQPVAPVLAGWTADVLIPLLELSGISVQREGAYFSIPSGSWAVVDACSGVNYLASVLVVSLFLAYTQFRSPLRRAAFIAGAIALGITGNWLRVFLTVVIAHLSENRLLYDEHGPFGWLVYAVLFVSYCSAWWRFREPVRESREATAREPGASSPRIAFAALLVAVSLVSARAIGVAAMPGDRPLNEIRIAQAGGWTSTVRPATPWMPVLRNPARQDAYSFRKDDRQVDLAIGWFQQETWDSKLVSIANRLVEPEGPWVLAKRSTQEVQIDASPLAVSASLLASPASRVLVWQWYWADDLMTGNTVHVKLAQLRGRLLSGRGASAWISISTPASERAAADLEAFVRDMGPALAEALAQTSVSSPR